MQPGALDDLLAAFRSLFAILMNEVADEEDNNREKELILALDLIQDGVEFAKQCALRKEG